MLTPKDICQHKPGLADGDATVRALLSSQYNHDTQLRKVGPDGGSAVYPTSTRFDQDRT